MAVAKNKPIAEMVADASINFSPVAREIVKKLMIKWHKQESKNLKEENDELKTELSRLKARFQKDIDNYLQNHKQ